MSSNTGTRGCKNGHHWFRKAKDGKWRCKCGAVDSTRS